MVQQCLLFADALFGHWVVLEKLWLEGINSKGGANNDLDVFRSGEKKEKAEKEAHEGHGKVNCKVDCKVNCKVSCKVSCTVTAMSLGDLD